MPDPFRKVRPNERVEFSATAWNAMLAAGQAELNHQFDSGNNGTSQIRQSGIIRVRNDSGINLNRNSVLGLDSPIFLPSDSEDAFLREVCFGGSVPTTDHRGRFCILLEPVLDGRIARAWVAGVCPVLVDVSDDAHTTADIEAGETLSLVSSTSGAAQILWREGMEPYGTPTGLQWAVVRFNSSVSGGGGGGGSWFTTGASGVPARVSATQLGSASATRLVQSGANLSNGATETIYSGAPVAIGGLRLVFCTQDTESGLWNVVVDYCETDEVTPPPPDVVSPPSSPPDGSSGPNPYDAFFFAFSSGGSNLTGFTGTP